MNFRLSPGVEKLRIHFRAKGSAIRLAFSRTLLSLIHYDRTHTGLTRTTVQEKAHLETGRRAPPPRRYKAAPEATIVLLIVTIIVAIFSFGIGRYPVPVADVVRILVSRVIPMKQNWPLIENTVVLQIRLPRILGALLVGASLAVAGASFQGMFRNPLVSPDILGVSSGAAVGAALAILLYEPNVMIQVWAFGFALIAVGLTYLISRQVKGNPTLSLVLAGIAIGSFFMALLSLFEYMANPETQLQSIVYWLMGSFNAVTMPELRIAAIPMLAGITILLLIRWRINVAAMGEEEAMALGINTNQLRAVIIICASVVTAAGVCISGTIGWVGLVIPHIGRMIVGPNHKVLLPFAVLLGALYLLCIDDVVRTVWAVELPIGIFTSIIGAPFFLYLLRKGRWGWV